MKLIQAFLGLVLLGLTSLFAVDGDELMELREGSIEVLAAGVDGDVLGSGEKGESTVYMGSWNGWHSFEYNGWFVDNESGQIGSIKGRFRCENLTLVSEKTGEEILDGSMMRLLKVDLETRNVYLDEFVVTEVVIPFVEQGED